MIKNREFIWQIVLQVAVTISCIVGYCWQTTWIWLLVAGVIQITISVIYTARRYREMNTLTVYVDKIQHGVESLDIRDNREGELSILKNEVYKLALKLLNQAELLKRDKMYLADSISDISHQLKTPLTSMMVMADLLTEDELPREKQKEFLHNIQSGLERMQWLVLSLLKLSKLDADAVLLKQETVQVEKLLNNALQPLWIPLEIKNQTLVTKGSNEVAFTGDFLWSTEAISNIVKNCIEHTTVGGQITISYGQNNLYTSIVIKDNGEGIDSEDLPHIFERFYKGKNASSESVGIGLALSKSILNRQKATLEVTSKPGQGTIFVIKFYV